MGGLRARVQSFEEEEAAHIVDDIGESDPHGGPGDTDSPNEEPRLRFLIGEDMLDTGPDYGLSCIGALDMAWHGLEMRLFPVNL